jgi:hypothetical protein
MIVESFLSIIGMPETKLKEYSRKFIFFMNMAVSSYPDDVDTEENTTKNSFGYQKSTL